MPREKSRAAGPPAQIIDLRGFPVYRTVPEAMKALAGIDKVLGTNAKDECARLLGMLGNDKELALLTAKTMLLLAERTENRNAVQLLGQAMVRLKDDREEALGVLETIGHVAEQVFTADPLVKTVTVLYIASNDPVVTSGIVDDLNVALSGPDVSTALRVKLAKALTGLAPT